MKPAYFHFIPFGLEKTVIDSQVIAPAVALRKEGIPVSLILLESLSFWCSLFDPAERGTIHRRLRGLPAFFLPRIPRNMFFLNTVMLAVFLLPHLLLGRRIVIQARGLQGTSYLLPLKRIFKKIKIICDVRGLEAEEYIYTMTQNGNRKPSRFQLQWKNHLEILARDSLKKADVKFCVSHAMMLHLQNWIQDTDKIHWEHVPCSVEVDQFSSFLKEREAERNKRGLQNRLVVVFSGACRQWQMPEQTVWLYKKIKDLAPEAFFLCLTPDVEDFSRVLQKHGIGAVDSSVGQVPFDEMARALACGDIGILLREENPINAAACPTKFAEYLACGLFVMATPAVRDVAQVIATEGVGHILNELTERQGLETELQAAIRLAADSPARIPRSVAAAKNFYDWNRTILNIKKWYLDLSSERPH